MNANECWNQNLMGVDNGPLRITSVRRGEDAHLEIPAHDGRMGRHSRSDKWVHIHVRARWHAATLETARHEASP